MRALDIIAAAVGWIALCVLVGYAAEAALGIARMAIECYGGGCPS